MNKKLVGNIFFFSIIACFISLFFVQTKNDNVISLEVLFKNNEHQYININELHDKIMMDVQKRQSYHSLKDINTRLLEDSIQTLSYVKNAEVYLSMNKLTIFIQQESPFIRTVMDGDTCFLTKDSVKLYLFEGELPKLLFFIGDISLPPWEETKKLVNYVYSNSFLNSIISQVSFNQDSEYFLYSNLYDIKINVGSVNELDKKVDKIKLFFTTILKDERLINNDILIKELNVMYDNQIICVN